ncbi:MAG: hypothetical protein AAF797_15490 [Planctomycetota bacterium]
MTPETGARRMMQRGTIGTGRLLAASMALAFGVGMGLPAMGQQAAGGDGRALDANPQAGSGGRNAAAEQPDYRARNNLITGNVAGGRAFQGQIDYVAPGQLNTGTSSDDLFRFRADALGSAPIISTRRNTAGQNFVGGNGGFSVFNEFTTAQSGSFGNANRQLVTRRPGGLQDQPSGLLVTSALVGDQTDGSATLGLVTGADGGALSVTASPLLGLRTRALDAGLGIDDEAQAAQELPRARRDADLEAEEQAGPGDGLTRPLGERINNRLDLSVPGEEAGETALAGLLPDGSAELSGDRVVGLASPSLLLGAELQEALRVQREDQLAGPDGNRQAGVEDPDEVTDPMDAADLPDADALEAAAEEEATNRQTRQERAAQAAERDILRPLRGLDDGVIDNNPHLSLLKRIRDGQTRDGLAFRDNADRQDWMLAVEDLDRDQLAAEQQRLRQLLGGDAAEVEEDPAAAVDEDTAIGSLIERLDYDLPRLESLAGERKDRVASFTKRAEQALSAGKFMEAEALFRQVTIDAPSEPLARVGLIHSQLGAGMIRSAALNLRRLFEDHPELIAMRYERSLLPTPERLTWLQKELQRMIASKNYAGEPGLMMAYLGYQTEAPNLVKFGLGLATSTLPNDPLLPLLKRIWLEGEAAPGADAGDDGAK